jgi:hypothetical protein
MRGGATEAMGAMPFGEVGAARPISETERNRVAQLLEGRGHRRLALAHLLGTGLRLAPGIDEKALAAEQITSALRHFEIAGGAYEELGAGSLLVAVQRRAMDVPVPGTWGEVLLAQALLDRACGVQLRALSSALAPVAPEIAARLDADDDRGPAESNLRALCAAEPATVIALQKALVRWLRAGLLSLGWVPGFLRGGAARGPCGAGPCGLVRDYLASAGALCDSCGLRFPPTAALELDLPAAS